MKESLISTVIWAIFGSVSISGLKLWGNQFHPGKDNISLQEWVVYMGSIAGQFVLMTICLWAAGSLPGMEERQDLFFYGSWWIGLVLLSVVLNNPQPGG
jgi:hypothetical protein